MSVNAKGLSTLNLEGEIVSEMATLMIASKKPECVRIPHFQSPKVQNALLESKNNFLREETSIEK